HEEKKHWDFFRSAAQEIFWPHIEQEYRDELTGIVEGLKARDVKLDVWDVVALNAWLEIPYYCKWRDTRAPNATPAAGPGDGVSAFGTSGMAGWVGARRAIGYSTSIDDFAHMMEEGNSGGYANTWLIADRKSSEAASLELGLKNVTLERTRDGFFVGSDFPAK